MARTRSARAKGKTRPQGRPRAATAAGSRGQGGQVSPPVQGRRATPPRAHDAGQTTADQAAVAARPRADAGTAAAVGGPPAWLQLSTLILSVGGLGISIYLTIAHYLAGVTPLACPNTGSVSCEKVINSPESTILGIPVAVLGLAFFVFMVAVNNPPAWRARDPLIHRSRLVSVVAGIGFVIYLIYVELFKVNAICLWCTAVHVITFALFVLVLLAAALWGVRETTGR